MVRNVSAQPAAGATTRTQTREGSSVTRQSRRILLHACLVVLSLAMVFPFFWMVSSSLKNTNDLYAVPPVLFPRHLLWSNYVYMFTSAPWGVYFFNTVKITVLVVLGQLITCSMAAYAFARLRFPGRDLIFAVYLGTIMIPYTVTMIPLFKIIKTLGWVNTHYALIVPALTSAFGTFLLRQFFLNLPQELEQAAMIDGCGYPRIFWHIILPNSRAALAALAIFTSLGTWNDFLTPLIYINSDQLKTLTLGLATFQGTYTTQWSYLMAGTVIVTLPMILIFLAAQRQFVQGVAMSGLKE